jgi:hypothetical protein
MARSLAMVIFRAIEDATKAVRNKKRGHVTVIEPCHASLT